MPLPDSTPPPAPPSAALPLSIVVCTYNRAALTEKALDTLCRQTADPALFEILVVDNNSTDGTRAMVEDLAFRFPRVRYVLETEQGLSHARNRGWREARGRYVGYFDDDAQAPPEWAAVALEIVAARAPEAFGGPYYACYDSPRPAWYCDAYGSREFAPAAGPLGLDRTLSGTNIFFRRDVLERLGGFDPHFGMRGNTIAYGEETVVQWRIQQEIPGSVLYYDPRLYILHLVRAEKMQFGRLVRQAIARGRYDARFASLRSRPPRPLLRQAGDGARSLARLVGRSLVGVWLRDRRRYPFVQNYLFETVLPQLRRLAAFGEAVRLAMLGAPGAVPRRAVPGRSGRRR